MKKYIKHIDSQQIQSVKIDRFEDKSVKNRWHIELIITFDDKPIKHHLGFFDPNFFQPQSSEIISNELMDLIELKLINYWKNASADLGLSNISYENRLNYAQFRINQELKNE